MIFTINHTGSGGNSYFCEFADGRKIMLEAGKTAKYNSFDDFLKGGNKVSDFLGYLVSHNHSDHNGALDDFRKVGMPPLEDMEDLHIATIKLQHNAENYGFIVSNVVSKEVLVFMTDFNAIIEKEKLYEAIRFLQNVSKHKIVFAVELSYCEFLYKKLPLEQRYGLQYHNSDEDFIAMFQFFKVRGIKIDNIVSLHASGREFSDKGFHADVCPKDYLTKYLRARLGTFVNIGANCMTYEF